MSLESVQAVSANSVDEEVFLTTRSRRANAIGFVYQDIQASPHDSPQLGSRLGDAVMGGAQPPLSFPQHGFRQIQTNNSPNIALSLHTYMHSVERPPAHLFHYVSEEDYSDGEDAVSVINRVFGTASSNPTVLNRIDEMQSPSRLENISNNLEERTLLDVAVESEGDNRDLISRSPVFGSNSRRQLQVNSETDAVNTELYINPNNFISLPSSMTRSGTSLASQSEQVRNENAPQINRTSSPDQDNRDVSTELLNANALPVSGMSSNNNNANVEPSTSPLDTQHRQLQVSVAQLQLPIPVIDISDEETTPQNSRPSSPINLGSETSFENIGDESSRNSDITLQLSDEPDGITQDEFIIRRSVAATSKAKQRKRRISSSEEANSKKTAFASSQGEEDEGLCCPICFDPWTTNGNHRLISLKCGHLFGRKCIERWLQGYKVRNCPQCNTKARKSDIRNLYAKKLIAHNNYEVEAARSIADSESTARRACEMELAKVRMQYHLACEESSKLKIKISELNAALATTSHQSNYIAPATTANAIDGRTCKTYKHVQNTVIMSSGGCRVMDFDAKTQQFAISQPSPHSSFIGGFGVKRLSASDFKSGKAIMLHQKPIKDLKFSHQSANHLLSASQDGCLRITDLAANIKIHEYKVGKPVWSCCWDQKDRHVIYAGLSNGTLMQYDLRNTSQAFSSIENALSKCPVVSLYHVPPTASESFRGRGGLFSGTLEGATFWQDPNTEGGDGTPLISDFKPTLLPLEPGSSAGLQYCHETQHCLVTYRPGRSYKTTTHLLCELQCHNAASTDPLVKCNVIDTYKGGHSHKMLTRNSLFVLPQDGDSDSRKLISCIGDEASKKVHIYDSNRSMLIQTLSSEGGPPLDITPVHIDCCKPMLAILSESTLKIYKRG